MTAAWKKLRFILSVRSDFHIIDSLLIAIHAFVNLVSMSFLVDSTLLPRYVNFDIYVDKDIYINELRELQKCWHRYMLQVDVTEKSDIYIYIYMIVLDTEI